MKQQRYILLYLITVFFALVSCVRETSRGDAFEASFILETGTVFDGDEFAFTVKTNRSQFKVVSFEFPLAPGLLTANTVCNVSGGIWTLREKVSVPFSQRGQLKLSIEDTETGLVKEFSALYTAYASTGLSLLIENEVVSSKNLTRGLPTVIGGDDFVFTVRSRCPRLILEDFSCEFNDGSLAVGGELFLEDGTATVRIPSVAALDGFDPKTLSLTLLDPDTGRDTTVTASYVTVSPFVPSVSLSSSHLIEGETASVYLRANRQLFHLSGYTGPEWFILNGYSPDSPEITLNLEGVASLQTRPLAVDESGSGTLRFELFDSEYTHRSVIVEVPYSSSVKSAPEDVSVSATDLKLCGGETASVRITTSTGHSTSLFTARIISSDTSILGLYAPSSDENAAPEETAPERFGSECAVTDGRLWLRATAGKWGPVTVRVFSKGNENVFKDISVYVRRDVALRLKGSFSDDICYWPDSIDDIFSNLSSGSEGIGWHGMPDSIDAELVSFENRSSKELTGLSKNEVSTWVKCFSLGDGSSSRLEVSFVITVGSRVTSNFFWGTYAGYSEPKSRLITGSGIDRTVSATRPSTINTTVSETAAYGNRVSCTRLRRALKELNCYADYQNGYGLFTMLRETRHCKDHLGFGSFDVALSSVDYDRDHYRLIWVMTFFEVPGEQGQSAPWWSAIGGERPWITPYSD